MRLKISRLNGCTGSIPVPGTIKSSIICKIRRFIKFLKPKALLEIISILLWNFSLADNAYTFS